MDYEDSGYGVVMKHVPPQNHRSEHMEAKVRDKTFKRPYDKTRTLEGNYGLMLDMINEDQRKRGHLPVTFRWYSVTLPNGDECFYRTPSLLYV